MNTSGSIPWVITLNVLNTVNEIWSSVSLTLAQIPRNAKEIMSNSSLVFNCLLYNCCFWELVFISLSMECHGSSILDSLFTISKHMSIWVEFPLVISVFLFTWLIVSMGLLVHILNIFVLIR